MTRVHSSHKIFTSVVQKHRAGLECRENFLIHHGRFYYMKRVPCKIGDREDKDAYAYLGLDIAMMEEQRSYLRAKLTNQDRANGAVYDSMSDHGLFMLVSTRPMTTGNAISMYCTRNQIEEVFGVSKGNGKLLPLCTATEETFRGLLLMTFISAVILVLLRDRPSDAKIPAAAVFEELRHQQGIVYEDAIISSVVVKK